MRFIHTADWHIGRSFRFVKETHRRSLLVEARLEVIRRIADRARKHGVRDVLVAGDVYDAADVGDVVLRQPLERMRECAPLRWHLIPGNHDPDRPGGAWDRLRRLTDLPANVVVYREPGPVELGDAVWLLPAPLRDRAHDGDPTAWMSQAPTPEGALRIGLAHGPVTDFARLAHTERRTSGHLIAPDRAERAGLDYLALGDWHAPLRVGPRTWYSGTPEADGFGRVERGGVLLVEIEAAGAPPRVESLGSGRFVWRRESAILTDERSVEALIARLRGLPLDGGLATLCLELTVEGALTFGDRAIYEDRLIAWLDSALACLRLNDERLQDAAGLDDLDTIATGGAVRLAAERLRARAVDRDDPERELARAALHLLYREQRQAEHP